MPSIQDGHTGRCSRNATGVPVSIKNSIIYLKFMRRAIPNCTIPSPPRQAYRDSDGQRDAHLGLSQAQKA